MENSPKISNGVKPKITFANWGNYTVALKSLFEELGLGVILPGRTNSQTITDGTRIAPEMFCFPLKVNLGNYLDAIKKGANTVFMATASGGSCRLRYYGVVQDKVLKEAGHKIDFIIFDQSPKDIFLKLKEISGASSWQIFEAFRFFYKKLSLVEKMEKVALYLRPREIKKGTTDKLLTECLLELENVKKKDFPKIKKEILNRFSEIKVDKPPHQRFWCGGKSRELPKIGLIGEIYTVCDPIVNFEVEKKLGQEGIEVHREMNLSYQLKKKALLKDFFIQRKIKPYLKSTVGGHGRDAIYEMLNYIKRDFDGVIQLLPMSCMPEVTVRPILEKIHQESGIPFLSLSFDEQVAEAGIDTRLEAFIDVVRNYHHQRISNRLRINE